MNRGFYLVFGTALISGVSIFINQFGVKVVNPYIFTGLKNIVVALLLVGIIFFLREAKNIKKLSKKNWLTLIIIGLVGGCIPFLMFFKGLSLSTGPEASYLHKFLFIFIAILAPLFLKEKLKWPYLVGLVFLVIGSILLFKVSPINIFNLGTGNALILGASLFWAVENLISKKAVASISPRIVAWGRMSFGSLFIVVYWVINGQFANLAGLQIHQFSWVFLTAILLFGYVTTWYTGLKYLPVTYASAILALGAPITSLLQLIQGKEFAVTQLWGMSIMFFGIIIFMICLRFSTRRSIPALHTN